MTYHFGEEVMTSFLVAVFAGIATFFGGKLALKFRDKIHFMLSVSAGAVMAVAFYDLLTEALETGKEFSYEPKTIIACCSIGWILYMLLDRWAGKDGDTRGNLGAGSLTIHSLFDGLAIGLSFAWSDKTGWLVSVAILAHDLSDGMNTVNLSMFGNGRKEIAERWLYADAFAPFVGVCLTHLFIIPRVYTPIIFAVLSGFFFYIGGSNLVIESYHKHKKFWITATTIATMALLYWVIEIAG